MGTFPPMPGSADAVFAAWLKRRGEPEPDSFDSLLQVHPEEAGGLVALHAQWQRLEPMLRLAGFDPTAPASFAERLRAAHGPDVDPAISLDPPSSDLGKASNELLKRLGKKSPGSRYRLEGEVARGGMGAILRVWDEDIRRHLAMKVVLGRGDPATEGGTPAVEPSQLARFLEEAQVTGQLDHPGIVPVHELGIDKDGRVFFTMKLVKGRDLKSIYDLVFEGKEGWSETRALTVLLKVCEAVAYAHKKGVIHRDLKPANVMVGDFGEVYVMDWGLARVVGRKDAHDMRIGPHAASSKSVQTERREEREGTPDSLILTVDGVAVGTAAYMSPEQARGEMSAVGVQSDVYSLGAMIYELVAGHPPYLYPGVRVGAHIVQKWVIDGPPKALQSLAPRAPAELIAIAEKAMQRDSARRYADTRKLADDLRAFLEQRVVGAYETGTWAETRKWVRRNKRLAAALVGVIASTAGGTIAYAVKADQLGKEAVEARAQKARADLKTEEALLLASSEAVAKDLALESQRAAENHAKETQAVADYLARVIQNVSPDLLGRAIHLRLHDALAPTLQETEIGSELAPTTPDLRDRLGTVDFTGIAAALLQEVVLSPALASADKQLADVPAVQAQLRMAVGVAQFCYGLTKEAEQTAALAATASEEVLGQTSRWTHRLNNLRVLCLEGSQGSESAQLLAQSTLKACEQYFGPLDIDTLTSVNNLGYVHQYEGRYSEALEHFVRAGEGFTAQLGENDSQSIMAMINIATTFMLLGEESHAQSLYDQLAKRPGFERGALEPMARVAMCNMGALLFVRGRHSEAEVMFKQALASTESAVGRAHPHYLLLSLNLSAVLAAQRRFDEADLAISDLLERDRIEGLLTTRLVMMAELQLGTIKAAQEQWEAAVAAFRRGRPLLLEQIAEEGAVGLDGALQYARAMFSTLDFQGAADLCEGTIDKYRSRLSPEDERLQTLVHLAGLALRRQSRFAEAEPYLLEAVAHLELMVSRGKDDIDLWADTAQRLVDSWIMLGRSEDVASLMHRIVEARTNAYGAHNDDTLEFVAWYGWWLLDSGNPTAAVSELRRAILDAELAGTELGALHCNARIALAFALRESGQLSEAETLFTECIAAQACLPGVSEVDEVAARRGLAVCLVRQGRFTEAEVVLLDVDARLRASSSMPKYVAVSTARNAIELFEAWMHASPHSDVDAKLALWRTRLGLLEQQD